MYFDRSLVFASDVSRYRCASAKEVEMSAIFYAVRKAIDLRILKIHIFSDAMDVIKALEGVED